MSKIFFIGKGSVCTKIVKIARTIGCFDFIQVIEDCSLGRSDLTLDLFCKRHNIEYCSIHNLNELNLSSFTDCKKGDILISFDNFLKIPQEVCEFFYKKSANFHPSLLPQYGGVNPISWGLVHMVDKWGYSWHRIEKTIDHGDLLIQESFQVISGMSQMNLSLICYMQGIKSFSNLLSILISNSDPILLLQEDTKERHFFSFMDVPILEAFESLDKLSLICNSVPITPYSKWRWSFVLPSGRSTDLITLNRNQLKFLPESSVGEFNYFGIKVYFNKT